MWRRLASSSCAAICATATGAPNAANAILDTTPIDETIAKRISDLPEVDEAQVRAARLTPPDGEERFLQLWTLPDLDATVGALYRQPGAVIPPPAGALLLEHSATPVLGLAQGDTVDVRLIDGTGRGHGAPDGGRLRQRPGRGSHDRAARRLRLHIRRVGSACPRRTTSSD